MAVTIKQIAEVSGVSRGTVDRVLNGRGKVRPEVEQRVREHAERLGYRPNKIGKALAYQKKPLVFGVVANGKGNSFFSDVVQGVRAAEAEVADFSVSVAVRLSEGYREQEQLRLLDEMDRLEVQGIAIAPIHSDRVARRINELAEKGVQIVIFNSDLPAAKRLCFVGCDYIKSGETAAGMLGRLLHRPAAVAVVTGSLQMLGHRQRVEGFRKRLAEGYPHLTLAEVLENGDNDIRSHKEVSRLLDNKGIDLGGIYFSAAGTAGGIRAVCEKGRQRELVLITCDDTLEIRQLLLEGTVDATICQQPYEQGYRAVKILFDRIVGKVEPDSACSYTENQIKILENL